MTNISLNYITNNSASSAQKLIKHGLATSVISGTLLATASKVTTISLSIFPILTLFLGICLGITLIASGIIYNLKNHKIDQRKPLNQDAIEKARRGVFDQTRLSEPDSLCKNVILKGKGMRMIRDRKSTIIAKTPTKNIVHSEFRPRSATGIPVIGVDNRVSYKTTVELKKK
ncbi:MAG: hypothetical protein WCT85_05735 [Parachlamydiales bacterium]|jgi:hypothetical protein